MAISRFGTMFFDDPVAAFRNVAGALRNGARLAIATWQPLTANAWLTIPGAELLRFATPPKTEEPAGAMFSQSDPGDLAATLTAAGFGTVVVDPVTVTMTFGATADEATEYLAASGPGRAVLETIAETDRPSALQAVEAVLAQHDGPNGVRLDGAIWVTTATLVR